MRKHLRGISALGAFFVVAVALSACGGGVPGNSVADVAGNPITTQAFNHWLFVAAESQASQTPGSPVIVPNDPPTFAPCVAQVRRQIPSLAKTAHKTLVADCKQLFTQYSSQVMDFLIKGYWYQAEAARDHVKVTNAQVQQAYITARVRTLRWSKPGSMVCSFQRLRIMSPAPISNTTESATSMTTRAERVLLLPRSASVRPRPCFRAIIACGMLNS